MASRRRRRRRTVPRKPAAGPTKSAASVPPEVPVKPADGEPTTPPVKASPSPAAPAKGAGRPPVKRTPPSTPTRIEAPDDPYIGRTIGRCTIEERIGLGKTAVVYRAHYEALDDVVAIKILTPQARSMPELVERFHSEAKVIARLDNENIVKVYDVGSDGDDHYMVMELLDGFSVLDLIRRDGQVDVMDSLRIVRQAAHGLAAAHAQGIIHRDVKPQNMLLLEDGTVKVLDFGLAARFDDKSERVGTPHYMAPEVCADGNADLGTDIYALGIVLYHLLVGQPPYSGQGVKEILRRHMEAALLRPERARPTLPKDVSELVRTLTKQDPLARPSAADVVVLLDAIGGEQLQEKGTLQRRRSSRSRARTEARKKSPLGAALAAIAIVVGLVVAVVAISGSSDDPGGSDPGGRDPGGRDSGNTGTVDVGGTDPAAVPTDPRTGPTPPVETDAERKEREARERAEAEAATEREKELEKAKREDDARRALGVVETWARESWRGPQDDQAVIDKYQSVYTRYKGTEAGTLARERLRGIKDHTIHPHPDRSYSDAQSIAEVRERWRTVKPEIEALIQEHRYATALGKLPERVNDADGELSGELRFWESLLKELRNFQSAVVKHAKTLADSDRMVQTPDGEGQVRIVETSSMKIRIGGRLEEYEWGQLDPAQILMLARSAFVGQDKTSLFVNQLAFAYAHRLQDAFWDLQLDLSGRPDIGTHQKKVSDLESRFEQRLKDR